jgi:hypothetical protein
MRRLGAVARIAMVAALVLSVTAGPALASGSASWKIQPTPNPTGATYSQLNGVTCISGTACTAVGTSNRAAGEYRTLVERWNGTKWSIQTSPNAKGSTGDMLNGVDCTSGKSCVAVGHYDKQDGTQVTLAERWNGTNWTIATTPNPAQTVSDLGGVSCVSATACVAVGGAGPVPSSPVMTLVERWNGTRWKIVPSPNPAGLKVVSLTGVSCSSATSCIAVGFWFDMNNKEWVLAERWNGTKWKIQSTPVPNGAKGSGFGAVSCSAASACTATGLYINASTVAVTLVERWNGTKWKIQSSPNPQGANATVLLAVSCPSASACTATGFSQSLGGQAPIAERWDGATWTLEVPINPPASTRSSLDGVACSSAQVCEAVGVYEDSSGNGLTLAEVSS